MPMKNGSTQSKRNFLSGRLDDTICATLLKRGKINPEPSACSHLMNVILEPARTSHGFRCGLRLLIEAIVYVVALAAWMRIA